MIVLTTLIAVFVLHLCAKTYQSIIEKDEKIATLSEAVCRYREIVCTSPMVELTKLREYVKALESDLGDNVGDLDRLESKNAKLEAKNAKLKKDYEEYLVVIYKLLDYLTDLHEKKEVLNEDQMRVIITIMKIEKFVAALEDLQ